MSVPALSSQASLWSWSPPSSSEPLPLLAGIRAFPGKPLVLSDSVFLPSDPVTYYTPLHIAVLRNQPDMVELLVHHGADINRRDRV